MQTSMTGSTTYFKPTDVQKVFLSLVLGILIGLICLVFMKSLELIAIKHLELNSEKWPLHLFLIPCVYFFLKILRKKTLFFPLKISDLTSVQTKSAAHWSPWMTVFHFLGTLLSHLSGASLGREGSVILMASGLIRIFRLNWAYWGPIAIGCGFSAVIGHNWIGVILITELFQTSFRQKLYTLLASCAAVLILETMHVQHLFNQSLVHVESDLSFFKKLFFVLALAVLSGFIMRFYKACFYFFSEYLKKSSFFMSALLVLFLMIFLAWPELRKFQSLGLSQIADLESLHPSFLDSFIKLFVTLISIGLGFWGGEFIPLIYSGVHFGASTAVQFNINFILGAGLGCYLFFAGATRLKWTSYFLMLSLVGWSWWFWGLFLIHLSVGFSGSKSLYNEDQSDRKFVHSV